MGKIKVEKPDSEIDTTIVKEEDTYDEKLKNANAISQPMAPKKLTKKIHKLIEKASKHKSYLRNGLKDVQVRLRKGETGIVIFAADVTPVEIMCHLPAVCEERNIPYCYTPSRKDLGAAMGVKRGTVAMLIREHPDYQEQFDKLKVEFNTLPMPS
ncbi:H/ACA ribonucleoprotein complex subunit 2-like protein [Toxorhynchites rutilus septentrionalis]|uniref:H/ACA ribonucleoprotein complex subunit 2-like protein n=1 Tax=Toxorhynchites rutilus septentrionalis TaxID=329112 RepID=UPI0024794C67|nr:H/ACA ribonucleoprotein complex subunit 2-like protein [Toxorhynchites rutilus septentrionalis]